MAMRPPGLWRGLPGDSVKLGLVASSLIEEREVRMLSLEEAEAEGLCEIEDGGELRKVRFL